jgi:hypothetical protein
LGGDHLRSRRENLGYHSRYRTDDGYQAAMDVIKTTNAIAAAAHKDSGASAAQSLRSQRVP